MAATEANAAAVAPQNLEAEERVIGGLLLAGSEGIQRAKTLMAKLEGTGLSAGDFYYATSHGTLFRTMAQLLEEDVPPDPTIVCARLERDGTLEKVKGRARVQELFALTPLIENVPHFAEIVVEMSRRRAQMNGGFSVTEEQRLHFLWGPDFIAKEDEVREPLLGTRSDNLIPHAGFVMVGGSGGAGKSTLTLHAIAHLASGTEWFGMPVPRPLRVGVIENEGPRQPYREKVQAFAEAWEGPDFLPQCAFLESPWGRFSFADDELRAELRAFIVDNEIDLLVAGPLGRLGMQGVGSPEETRMFLALLGELGVQRDVAVWLLHHINKGRHPSIVDALSGDWGGHPDTILGVEHEGGRRTKLTFGKVRFGDQGRAPLILEWLPSEEGIGYRVVETAAASIGDANRERIYRAVLEGTHEASAVAKLVGLEKRTVAKHFLALEKDGRIELRDGPNKAKLAYVIDAETAFAAQEAVPTEELAWR